MVVSAGIAPVVNFLDILRQLIYSQLQGSPPRNGSRKECCVQIIIGSWTTWEQRRNSIHLCALQLPRYERGEILLLNSAIWWRMPVLRRPGFCLQGRRTR